LRRPIGKRDPPRREPTGGEQLVVENLFDDSHVVVAGAQNPWTRRRKIALAELVNEPWTLLPFDIPAGGGGLSCERT